MKASKQTSASNRAFYLLIGVIAVLGIAALTYQATRPTATIASPIDTTLPPVASYGYVMGNPSAPIEVTEFGDFECPGCGKFAELTEPDIRKNYVNTGKIRWRFIDFPLSMHRNTWQASRAAACADEQGKFWEFHDALYSTQDQWNGEVTTNPDGFMKELGERLGLDKSKFNSCVDDKKTQAKIQAHHALAIQRQIGQTPTFIIGNLQVAGAQPYDAMARLLDSALAKAPKATPPAKSGDTARGVALPGAKNGR